MKENPEYWPGVPKRNFVPRKEHVRPPPQNEQPTDVFDFGFDDGDLQTKTKENGDNHDNDGDGDGGDNEKIETLKMDEQKMGATFDSDDGGGSHQRCEKPSPSSASRKEDSSKDTNDDGVLDDGVGTNSVVGRESSTVAVAAAKNVSFAENSGDNRSKSTGEQHKSSEFAAVSISQSKPASTGDNFNTDECRLAGKKVDDSARQAEIEKWKRLYQQEQERNRQFKIHHHKTIRQKDAEMKRGRAELEKKIGELQYELKRVNKRTSTLQAALEKKSNAMSDLKGEKDNAMKVYDGIVYEQLTKLNQACELNRKQVRIINRQRSDISSLNDEILRLGGNGTSSGTTGRRVKNEDEDGGGSGDNDDDDRTSSDPIRNPPPKKRSSPTSNKERTAVSKKRRLSDDGGVLARASPPSTKTSSTPPSKRALSGSPRSTASTSPMSPISSSISSRHRRRPQGQLLTSFSLSMTKKSNVNCDGDNDDDDDDFDVDPSTRSRTVAKAKKGEGQVR